MAAYSIEQLSAIVIEQRDQIAQLKQEIDQLKQLRGSDIAISGQVSDGVSRGMLSDIICLSGTVGVGGFATLTLALKDGAPFADEETGHVGAFHIVVVQNSDGDYVATQALVG